MFIHCCLNVRLVLKVKTRASSKNLCLLFKSNAEALIDTSWAKNKLCYLKRTKAILSISGICKFLYFYEKYIKMNIVIYVLNLFKLLSNCSRYVHRIIWVLVLLKLRKFLRSGSKIGYDWIVLAQEKSRHC